MIAIAQDLTWWKDLLRDVGYPALFVVGTAFAVWRLVKWAKPWAERIAASHLGLVDTVAASQKTIEKAQVASAETVAHLSQSLDRMVVTFDQLARALAEHRTWSMQAVEGMRSELKQIKQRLPKVHGKDDPDG